MKSEKLIRDFDRKLRNIEVFKINKKILNIFLNKNDMQISEKKLKLPSTQCSRNIMQHLMNKYLNGGGDEKIGFSDFMQKINYPLKINRSVLTSVNQHNWPILCGAFAWLCEEIEYNNKLKNEINNQFENKTEKGYFKFYVQESQGKIKMNEIINELAQDYIIKKKSTKIENASLEIELLKIKKKRKEIKLMKKRKHSILRKREEMKSKIQTLRHLEKNFPQTFEQLTHKKQNIESQKTKLLDKKTKLELQLETFKKKIENQKIKKWQAEHLIDSIKQNKKDVENLTLKKNTQEKKNYNIMRRIEEIFEMLRIKFGLIKAQNLSLMFKFIKGDNISKSLFNNEQWLAKSSFNPPLPDLDEFEKNVRIEYTCLNKQKTKLNAEIFKVGIDMENLNNVLENLKQELNEEQKKIVKFQKYSLANNKKTGNLLQFDLNSLISKEIIKMNKINQENLRITALKMEIKILETEIINFHDLKQESISVNDLALIKDIKNIIQKIQTDNQILKLISDNIRIKLQKGFRNNTYSEKK